MEPRYMDQRESSPPPEPNHPATSPFDSPNARGADTILRSTDNMEFHVSSAMIAFSCPTLYNNIPRDARGQISHPRPVIDLQISSTAIYYILHFVYPSGVTPLPDVFDLNVFADVVAFSKKYEITQPIDSIRGQAKAMLTTDPYRVLVLARQHGWDDVEKGAIFGTFRKPYCDIPFFPELKELDGIQFRRILKLRTACSQAFVLSKDCIGDAFFEIHKKRLVSFNTTTDGTHSFIYILSIAHQNRSSIKLKGCMSVPLSTHNSCNQGETNATRSVSRHGLTPWFVNYRNSVIKLLEEFPHPETLDSDEATKHHQKLLADIAETCSNCILSIGPIQEELKRWNAHMKQEVEQLINKTVDETTIEKE